MSAFSMGEGVLERWKVFRRKSCDAIAMILKIDGEQIVQDGALYETSPEVRSGSTPLGKLKERPLHQEMR